MRRNWLSRLGGGPRRPSWVALFGTALTVLTAAAANAQEINTRTPAAPSRQSSHSSPPPVMPALTGQGLGGAPSYIMLAQATPFERQILAPQAPAVGPYDGGTTGGCQPGLPGWPAYVRGLYCGPDPRVSSVDGSYRGVSGLYRSPSEAGPGAAGGGGFTRQRLTSATQTRPVPSAPGVYDGGGAVEEEHIHPPEFFRTEHAFLERSVRLDYLSSNHVEAGEGRANDSRFVTEVNYAFTNWFGVVFDVPYAFLDRFEESNTSGFGDIEAGVRYVVLGYNERSPFKLTAGLNVTAPTGSTSRSLGEGRTSLEPVLLVYQQLTETTFLQSSFGYEFGVGGGGEDTRNEFRYNVGLAHVFNDIKSPLFSFPAPVLELNGATSDRGETVVELTPGIRWQVGRRGLTGVAYSFPVTDRREFNGQFIFSFIYHFQD